MSVNWTGSGSNLLRRKTRQQLYAHRQNKPIEGAHRDRDLDRHEQLQRPLEQSRATRAESQKGIALLQTPDSVSGLGRVSAQESLNEWLLSKPDWSGTQTVVLADAVDTGPTELQKPLFGNQTREHTSVTGSHQSKLAPIVESKSHSK